jgi:hypothetical protein
MQRPGDVAEMQTLVTDVDGFLHLRLIERPPLGEARYVDPTERLHHLSGTAPASGRRNGG